jgi:hypothetical protein
MNHIQDFPISLVKYLVITLISDNDQASCRASLAYHDVRMPPVTLDKCAYDYRTTWGPRSILMDNPKTRLKSRHHQSFDKIGNFVKRESNWNQACREARERQEFEALPRDARPGFFVIFNSNFFHLPSTSSKFYFRISTLSHKRCTYFPFGKLTNHRLVLIRSSTVRTLSSRHNFITKLKFVQIRPRSNNFFASYS